MAISFTDDQKLAIDAKGTVLVSAAAGSGKTAVLTERVAQIVCDKTNGINADELLIVTFTNAAAAELRARISSRIYEMSREHIGDSFYAKQKMLLQSAKICSIDAFCLDLVRKNFSVLSIEPDFSISDNATVDRYADKVLDDILLRYYAADDDDFDCLGRVFGIDSGEKLLKTAVRKIYDYAITLPLPKQWLTLAAARYQNGREGYSFYTEQLLRDTVSVIDETIALCSTASREVLGVDIAGKLIDFYSNCADFLKSLKGLISEEKYREAIEFVKGYTVPRIAVTGCRESAEVIELIRRFNKDIGENVKEVCAVCLSSSPCDEDIESDRILVSKLCEIVLLFYDEFFQFMSAKKQFTFAMIEHLALEILCDEVDGKLTPSALSKDICKNYKCVLVDEYQDNNDLQDALFFAVSDGGKNLFMVGDVKQCVYGFRNANPDNFLKYKTNFPLYSEGNEKSKIIFKNNFRSRKGVCDFVNEFCNTVMLYEVSGMEYSKEDELVASAQFPDIDKPIAEVYLCDNGTKLKNEEVEAEEIAQYIARAMEEDAFIRDGKTLRRAKYSDFAILMRSPGSRHVIYETALKRHGIPVSAMSDTFIESPEIMAIISLLNTLNNPSRDIPLAAVMTSAFFGFSYDDLVKIKSNNKDKSLYAAVLSEADNENEQCKRFLKQLSSLKARSAIEPLGRFISNVCEEYLIATIYGRLSNLQVVSENIDLLISMADSHYLVYGNDIKSFVASLERQSDLGNNSLSDGNDAVRLMSFHKSKGLQFPVCILASIGSEFQTRDLKEKYIFSNLFGVAVKHPGEKKFEHSAAGMVIENHRKRLLIAEEIRVFYVALTRAEDRLVVFGTSRSLKKDITNADLKLSSCDLQLRRASVPSVANASSYLELLLLSLIMQADGEKILSYAGLNSLASDEGSRFKVTVATVCEESGEQSVDSTFAEQTSYISDPVLNEQLRERLDYIYPYIEDCKRPSKFAVTELVHGESKEYSFTLKPRFMQQSGLTPAEKGTAMHKFMQFADFKAAETDPEAELTRLREWEFLSEEEAASIDVRYIKMFFESDMYKRFKGADELLREYKFMVEYPLESGSAIVQGIADSVLIENGELVIFDFKTDSIKAVTELLDRYKKQLDIYKDALEKIFEMPVKECVLYSLKLGKHISF